jgi:23S rRNA pseudouridine1911/1915/1917 synthase
VSQRPLSQAIQLVVKPEDAGVRLDRFVSSQLPDVSRTRVQELVEARLVLVNGKSAKDSYKIRANDSVEVTAAPRPPLNAEPEQIPLDIIYEDDDLIAVNKPAGMAVHAGAGNSRGTLVNALLGRGQTLSTGGDALRPGIVHRLDKETSGLLLVAKNDTAHAKLAEGFRRRTIQKTYLALAQGVLKEDNGRIELPIARDPRRRNRMTARNAASLPNARAARTDWRVLARIDSTTLLEIRLHTGRTHQIRVHLAALKRPVVGDTLYGASEQLRVEERLLPTLGRNFLHAAKLVFAHPTSGKVLSISAPLPDELRTYLGQLARAAGDDPRRIDAALAAFL